jgi:ferric-dicitrate binding protein FerR (iron transport regulator)
MAPTSTTSAFANAKEHPDDMSDQMNTDQLAIRLERQDAEYRLLSQQVTHSQQQLTAGLVDLRADVKQMAAAIEGMAPHAQAIGQINRYIEKMDISNSVRDAKIEQHEKQINFWRGGLSLLAIIGGTAIGFVFHTLSKSQEAFMTQINEVRDAQARALSESKVSAGIDHGRIEKRLDRLEGIKEK